ncbi:MAG: hypothetical protein ACP5OJ_07735 [Methanothermobacter sp.]
MADSNKDIITITKVENLKDNNRLDKNEELDLFIDLANLPGFKNDDEIIILKCSDFPEVLDVNSVSELRKKIEDTSDNVKRVRELKQKLESAEASYSESLKVIKIKTDLEVEKLKNENKTLKLDNKELSLRLKDVTRRINELNSLLNDL